MVGDKGKRILIHLSSSSSSSSSDVDDESCSASASFSSGEEWDSIDEDDEDRDVYEGDESEVEDADADEEDEESFENGCQGAEDIDDDDDDSLCNRVIQFLQEKKDLHELSLKACKAYLRQHGLRVSGNKDVCVKRVREHWRIKDGKAEILYPRSSFVINCTGDVCKGDVVLFTQKVYGSFDKVTRNGKLLGHRTVAGRVVKESYGAAKQQHTFTVEVLWSKGIKKLPPLLPLLVKGRNLYRLKSYRQPWKNEAARRKVLAEKHRRGTVARMERAKRKKARSTRRGGKFQKASQSIRQSQKDYSRSENCDDRDQRASSSKHSTVKFDFRHSDVKHGAGAHVIEATCSRSFPGPENLIFLQDRRSELRSYLEPSHRYPQPLVESHRNGFFQNEIPFQRPVILPEAQHNGFRDGPFFRDFYGIRSHWISHADSWRFLPGHRRNSSLKCAIQGCNECGTDRCVIAACWRCCRREGMRCSVHR